VVHDHRSNPLHWFAGVGYNPKLDQKMVAKRRRIKVDQELPMGEEYAALIERILRPANVFATTIRPS
jgi:hypothetical protein